MIRTFVAFAGLADDRGEERVLAVEIGVERGLGDPGLARDRVHAGGAIALGHEEPRRRLHHLPALALRRTEGGEGNIDRVRVVHHDYS